MPLQEPMVRNVLSLRFVASDMSTLLHRLADFFGTLTERPGSPDPILPPVDEPIIAGHRGSPLHHPENTIRSFARALDDGANALELDLCITSDNVIVAWHDWTADAAAARARWLEIEPKNNFRPIRPKEQYQKPLAELDLATFRREYGYREKESDEKVDVEIPTLEEVLEWGAGRKELKTIFLDVKIPNDYSDRGEAFVAELDRIAKPYEDRFDFVIETAAQGMLRHLRTSAIERARLSFDQSVPPGLTLDPDKVSSAREAERRNLRASLVLRPRLYTIAPWTTYRRIIRHELSIAASTEEAERPLVVAATINRPEEYRYLRALGVGAFQTDVPGEMVGEERSKVKGQNLGGR